MTDHGVTDTGLVVISLSLIAFAAGAVVAECVWHWWHRDQ